MWNFGRAYQSGQKESSILKMDNRFGSGGLVSAEKTNTNLYPNRWNSVNKNKNSDEYMYIEIICILPKLNISFEYHRLFGFSNVCIRWSYLYFSRSRFLQIKNIYSMKKAEL
jgi:hypothetical protein